MATKVKKAPVFDDYSTQADDQISPHDMVEVVSGPHEGRYGALLGLTASGDALLRSRDEHSERLVVAPSDCRPTSRRGR